MESHHVGESATKKQTYMGVNLFWGPLGGTSKFDGALCPTAEGGPYKKKTWVRISTP